MIDTDHDSERGPCFRIIGFSVTADDVIAMIVLANDGTDCGAMRKGIE